MVLFDYVKISFVDVDPDALVFDLDGGVGVGEVEGELLWWGVVLGGWCGGCGCVGMGCLDREDDNQHEGYA